MSMLLIRAAMAAARDRDLSSFDGRREKAAFHEMPAKGAWSCTLKSCTDFRIERVNLGEPLPLGLLSLFSIFAGCPAI